MKYISLFTLLILIPNMTLAAESGNDVKYHWALAALGDTINTYYQNYTGGQNRNGEHDRLALGMLTSMGNLLKEDSYRTKKELVDNCRTATLRMLESGLFCDYSAGCTRNDKKYAKTQRVIAPGEECTSFVNDLETANKKYVKERVVNAPGTYIKKTDKCGGAAYQVVNVVPGKDTDNKIYLINDNGTITRWDYNTQKNGTFINETAETKDVTAGQIRGVYKDSYIFRADVTQAVYRRYNSGRGTALYSAGAGIHLLPKMDYDFKSSWTEKTCDPKNFGFRVTDQTDTQAHTNGVIFKGQVVTLENLGHIITGMHQEDSVAPDSVVEATVSKLQGVNLGGTGDGAAVGAWYGTDSAAESNYANDIRADAYDNMKNEKDDTTFKDTKTEKEQDAYNMARNHMAKTYNLNVAKITCGGECNYTHDDFVTCYYKNGNASKVVVYKFDSICKVSLW